MVKWVLSNFLHKTKFLSVPNDSVLDGSLDTLKNFGIKEEEYNLYEQDKYLDIILEKVAMVDIIK